MGAHGAHNSEQSESRVPDAVPFELTGYTRVSWELGTRVVDNDNETVFHSSWSHTSSSWDLDIYEATSNTVLLCLRTPVERERYYSTTQIECESALSSLVSNPYWQQAD
ncbi:hypothetical protein ACFQJ7_00265 [Halovenus rubra]|uniref:Uncharacterized protein n=2 Tax=Halovenus rubra TaxID=869890 RepID=A0ABD5X1S8_9EURY|nr:hypothetical protein [Halovenus rubra]